MQTNSIVDTGLESHVLTVRFEAAPVWIRQGSLDHVAGGQALESRSPAPSDLLPLGYV